MIGGASRRPWLIAALGYTALALLLTWPLATHLSTTLANDLGDPALNAWILWWNAHAVPLTARWWNAPIFWPAPGSLALSEVLLGISVVTTPLQWLGATPAAAYNIAFLLTFPLSALAAHALVFVVTERHDAGAVAGLIYGFNPYRMAQLPHIQVLASYGMPLALVGLHLYLRTRASRWLALFGVAWLLQALSNGYFLVYFPILIVLWIAWFVRDRRAFAAIAAAWALASVPLVPILLEYREVHGMYEFRRGFGEINFFSADVTSFLDATTLLRFWDHLTAFHHPEGELFPGLTAALLVGVAVVLQVRDRTRGVRITRASLAMASIAAALAAVALSAIVMGPWSIAWRHRPLLTVAVPAKPFSIALLFALLAVLFDPRAAAAVRARAVTTFYLLAAAILFLLALGPRIRAFGQLVVYGAPYEWLMWLPGFSSLRVPTRITMVALVALSACAALAFAAVTERRSRSVRTIAAAIVCLGILADSWIHPMPLPAVPAHLSALDALPPDTAILELPLGDDDPSAMYRQTWHEHPIVNGFSGYYPPHYEILKSALDAGDESVLDLASPSPLVVAVDTSSDLGRRWSAALARDPRASRAGGEAGWELFHLPVQPRDVDPSTRPLSIAAVAANRHPEDAAKAIDGDIVSRWASGAPQAGGEAMTIDLGAPATVSAVSLSIGQYSSDYPQELAIDVSDEGSAWTRVWAGGGSGPAVVAAERDVRVLRLVFAFKPARGRWIRLTQTGVDRVHHWSIAELGVFGR